MGRFALWTGITALFGAVTFSSFCVGKYLLGDRLLNKPQIETNHLPGETASELEKRSERDSVKQFDQQFPGERSSRPRVVLEVKPPSPSPSSEADDSQTATNSSRESDDSAMLRTAASTLSRARTLASPTPLSTTRREPEDNRESKSTETKQSSTIKSSASRDSLHSLPQPAPDRGRTSDRAAVTVRKPAQLPVPAPARSRTPEPPASPARAPAATHSGPVKVQVGLFSMKENADQCIASLQNQGHRVIITEEVKEGASQFRVQIGPFRDRESALKVREELVQQGFVGSFVPQ